MATIKIKGDTSGEISLTVPGVAGTNTLTLPASTGNISVDGPIFRAYMSSDTTVSDAVYTKVPIDTVLFDTTNDFDTTNNRYIPSVAGYYNVHGVIKYNSGTKTAIVNVIYKNGSAYEIGEIWRGSQASSLTFNHSCIVYMNGTTDYIELYGYVDVSAGTPVFNFSNTTNGCFLSAHFIRPA